eukprot:XP_001698124.1 predicted protein [Chlamydomonas reinhardtii]
MLKAVVAAGPKYAPPGYNKIRTTLLDKVKKHVKEKLQPFFEKNKRSGCTVTSDGWSDARNRPILNIMVCARGEAVFYKSVDMSSVLNKTGEEIAQVIIAAIEELGADDIVAVITDSAANCKVCWALDALLPT